MKNSQISCENTNNKRSKNKRMLFKKDNILLCDNIFNTYRNIHKIGRFNWGRYLCSLIWCSTGWTVVFLLFLYLIGVNLNQIIFNCLCMAILAILIILTILAIFLVVDFNNSLNLKRMDRVKVLVFMSKLHNALRSLSIKNSNLFYYKL